jgi:formimidoylglutamate deiminase
VKPLTLWAPRAWIAGRWRDRVLLSVGADGRWRTVAPDTECPPEAERLPGDVLPGLVDAHSHAFQRAFAGLAERRAGAGDDFWSWRDRMYGVALRLTPAQLRAVAAQLYLELLAGGYTQVCEFHYLHHAPDGSRYGDPLAMVHALAGAAADTGIGLTLLPVLYERAGFARAGLRDDQRRFATGADDVIALRDGVRALGLPEVSAGVAIHSLRAASAPSIHRLLRRVGDDAGPIHVHVAEQTGEVDDCVAATGLRPIEWLCKEVRLDARWQLVHATHATPQEIECVGSTGAGVVLCPTTEANLGDGLPDLPRWLATPAMLSVGSDSQVGRSWVEELRWLEYGQRLAHRVRNVAADPALGLDATAARLFGRTLAGGAVAAGMDRWGLVAGARADLLVLDGRAPGLRGVPASHALDALVFASGAPAWAQVWVGGRCVLRNGAHEQAEAIGAAFEQTLREVWAAGA